MTRTLTPETIHALAAAAGITVSENDAARLATALREHLDALDALTRRLDLGNVDPPLVYDARWS